MMKEIIKGVSLQEYNLTIIRLSTFLAQLGKEHKKSTTLDRLTLYDFYLKYPELTSEFKKKDDFDTKYSYFHWKPNYKLYSAVLVNLVARNLICISQDNNRYYITDLGLEFVSSMNNSYIDMRIIVSEYIIKSVCKLSNKAIISDIDNRISMKRGLEY